VQKHSQADVIIMAAAVSDFSPENYHQQKIKKEGASAQIDLQPTTDILEWLGKHRKSGQILIGFAMETEDLIKNAAKKRDAKKVDWIIANSLNGKNTGFAVDTNTVQLLGEESQTSYSGSKKEVARQVLAHIFGN